MAATLQARFQFRRDPLENWEAHNPILAEGEPSIAFAPFGIIFKIGDGIRHWKDLPEMRMVNSSRPTRNYKTLNPIHEVI